MIALSKIKLKDVVFIDIETAPLVPELELDTPLFESWEYKKKREGLDNQDLIKTYFDEAALYPEFARIVCISVGRVNKSKLVVRTYNDEDEKVLLEKFNNDLQKVTYSNPKTVFCGHAAIGFDIPFVFKRCIINQIRPHELLDTAHLKPWEVTTIDTQTLWKGTSFSGASLINIAVALDIPSPKDDIFGQDVGKVFWSKEKGRIERISRYCEKDVLTTANVVRKCRFEPLLELEISSQDVSIESNPVVKYLMDGGRYGTKHKDSLVELFKGLSEDEREQGFIILEAIVSNASGKKTKFQKAHIKAIKEEMYKM